ILPGSHWEVLEKKGIAKLKNNLTAIAFNNAQFIQLFHFNPKAVYFYKRLCIHRYLKDFNPQKYKYVYVCYDRDKECSGLVFEDDPEKTQEMIERFYR
ncbi:hypothetical protein, partial [Nostoc sp.]